MKIPISLFCMFALLSCNNLNKGKQETVEKDTSAFSVILLENYFPKNNIEFTIPIKTMVVKDKKRFDEYFGLAQTMNNTATNVDFEKNKVVALITKPSEEKLEIKLTETVLKNNKLLVKYRIIKGEKQSFISSDLKLFAIPKSVYAVDFVVDTKE
jgi:hypothetical protein